MEWNVYSDDITDRTGQTPIFRLFENEYDSDPKELLDDFAVYQVIRIRSHLNHGQEIVINTSTS